MKRLLCAVIVALMLISSLSVFCFAAISVVTDPVVLMGGEDQYNIVWTTTQGTGAIGYVKYTYNGITYTAYDESNGVVRTDDYIHAVKVPMKHLDAAGSYTIGAHQVTGRAGHSVTYSGSAVEKTISGFKGYTNGDENSSEGIRILTISDIHLAGGQSDTNYTSIMSAVNTAIGKLSGTKDIIAIVGDPSDDCGSKTKVVDYIIKPASTLSKGKVPVIYSRGNHETRGAGSTYIRQYFSGDTGELYFGFNYGPLSGLILDCGEDKVDTHYEYGGLNDFANYRIKEGKWIDNEASYNPDATYKITFAHDPTLNKSFGCGWMSSLQNLGTDLLVSGHSHNFRISYPENLDVTADTVFETGYRASSILGFPIFEEGGHYDYKSTDLENEVSREKRTFRAGMVILKGDAITCTGYGTTVDGKQIKIKCGSVTNETTEEVTEYFTTNFTFKPSETPKIITVGAANTAKPVTQKTEVTEPKAETSKTEATETETLPTAFGSAMTNVIKAAAPSFSITTKPVVFDTGDTYTISWGTTSGYESTAVVNVRVNDAIYRYIDQDAGSMYTSTNLHAVKVPKNVLEGNMYKVTSKRVIARVSHYRYDWKQSKDGENCFGEEVTTGYIPFDGYDGSGEVDMLVLSDVNSDYNNIITNVRKNAGAFDLLVLNGNTVNSVESANDVINKFLYYIGLLTSGMKPVVFVRGENEASGAWGPYLSRICGNVKNGFYFNVEYGPVSAIVLDTSAVAKDSWTGYGGMAKFDSIREKQYEWLSQQDYYDSEYKFVFSRTANVHNHLGYRYAKHLNLMDTDLAVIGQGLETELLPVGYRAQNFQTLLTGSIDSDATMAHKINCKNGVITINTINKSGTTIKTNTVRTSDNDEAVYTDVAPKTWYSDAVEYVSLQQVMIGTEKESFSPDTELTRGMAATVLHRLSGVEETDVDNTPFTDVESGKYYTDAVNWAYANGVVKGTTDTTFDPEASLTREQLATMVYRMYKDNFDAANECDFDDFDTVSDWAKEAVATLALADVVNGMGDGVFSPKATVTRAMLAQIVYKAGL